MGSRTAAQPGYAIALIIMCQVLVVHCIRLRGGAAIETQKYDDPLLPLAERAVNGSAVARSIGLDEDAIQQAMMVADMSPTCHSRLFMICLGPRRKQHDNALFALGEKSKCSDFLPVSDILKLALSPTGFAEDQYTFRASLYRKRTLASMASSAVIDRTLNVNTTVEPTDMSREYRMCSTSKTAVESVPVSSGVSQPLMNVLCTPVSRKEGIVLEAIEAIALLAAVDGKNEDDSKLYPGGYCMSPKDGHYWRDACCQAKITMDGKDLCATEGFVGRMDQQEAKRAFADRCGLSWPEISTYESQCPQDWKSVPGSLDMCWRKKAEVNLEGLVEAEQCCLSAPDSHITTAGDGDPVCYMNIGSTSQQKQATEAKCRVLWPLALDWTEPCPQDWKYLYGDDLEAVLVRKVKNGEENGLSTMDLEEVVSIDPDSGTGTGDDATAEPRMPMLGEEFSAWIDR